MRKLTSNQVRILATIKLYHDKSNPKPPRITNRTIQKELPDLKQGTISGTLHQLEYRYGLVVSVQMQDIERVLYANQKSPGLIRKYYITGLGNKTINRHLLLQAKRSRSRLYEKLFGTTDNSIRESEGHFA
tara:strand:+ start:265 stop:657 length:393 start_codon:yes stop_codon:yes gene_type:complete